MPNAKQSLCVARALSCDDLCVYIGGDALRANSHGHTLPRRHAICWRGRWKCTQTEQMKLLKLRRATWSSSQREWAALGMYLKRLTNIITLNEPLGIIPPSLQTGLLLLLCVMNTSLAMIMNPVWISEPLRIVVGLGFSGKREAVSWTNVSGLIGFMQWMFIVWATTPTSSRLVVEEENRCSH